MRLAPDGLDQRMENFLPSEDQLVHHGREGIFQIHFPDVLQGAGADIIQMLLADPNRIPDAAGGIDVPLKAAATFATDELAGKGITILVSRITLFDVLLLCPLLQKRSGCFEILPADESFVMVFHIELIPFASIHMPLKPEIGVGLLEKAISDVLLVCEDAPDRGRRPVPALPGRHLLFIELPRNRRAGFSAQGLFKNPPHPLSFIFVDEHLTILHAVAVWRVPDLESSVFKAMPDTPFAVL